VDIETTLKQAAAARGLNDRQLVDSYAALGVETERLRSEGRSPMQERRVVVGMTNIQDEMNRRDAELARAEEALVASSNPRGTVQGGHIAAMAAQSGRTGGSPERGGARGAGSASTAVVTASLAGPDSAAGAVLTDKAQLAEVMSETLRRTQADPKNFGRKHRVASVRWSYPEDRQLGANAEENTRKIDAVCDVRAPRVDKGTGALVATGGVCLPTNVDYSVPTWSSTDRPLRDALPGFEATRGGVQFVTPPDIGTVTLQGGTASGSGLATSIWTEATDANPAGATKPVWAVSCGSPVQIYVDAIPTRVQFGNMQSRFAPEQIAANTEQAMAAAAREADLNLLTKMYDASNQVLASQYLGATRDLLASVDVIAPQYRYSHRYPKGIGLVAIFPEWAADLIRADMARELAHDNAGSQNALAITDAQIEDWFSVRGIDVVWTMDGLEAGTYGTGGHAIPAQYWPKFTAGNKPQWPGQTSDGTFVLSWLLFVTGSFQFLDGGRLDLGVVRDSVLDATNDYEEFVETFEGIAFRGNEVYQIQSTVLPTGASAATQTSTYHE
jgi:hypothetical protein